MNKNDSLSFPDPDNTLVANLVGMSNLVPELRTDKNGVTSKRWVRPESASSSDRRLPAPVGAKGSQSASCALDTPLLDKVYKRGPLSMTHVGIDSFDPAAVRVIENLLEKAHEEGWDEGKSAERMVQEALKKTCNDIYDLSPLHNIAAFTPELELADNYNDLELLINGVHRVAFVRIKDFWMDADENQRNTAKALMVAASELNEPWSETAYGDSNDGDIEMYVSDDDEDDDESDGYTRITSERLAEFIRGRPEDVEAIIMIVNERNTDDPEIIRDILEHDESSLRSGLL